MMYVNYREMVDAVYEEKTLEWKVGDKCSLEQIGDYVSILSVYADGEELAYIVKHIQRIPYTEPKCIWRGSFARFIVDNLGEV